MSVLNALRLVCLSIAFLLGSTAAQGNTLQPPTVPTTLDATTAEALERLATSIASKTQARAAAHLGADAAATAPLDAELKALRWQFAGLVARLDVQQFEAPTEHKFDLQEQLEELLRPALQHLKDATAGPRQISELKARIDILQTRKLLAEAAQRATERTRGLLPPNSPARDLADQELRQRWQPAIGALNDEILILQANQGQLEERQRSMLQVATEVMQDFVQDSGRSLVLCAVVFVTVFFGLRFLGDRLTGRSRSRGFSVRLVQVLFRLLAAITAIAATLVVPYARNDWFLLAIGIVFLLGAGWVVMRMLPQFFEQLRLLLNVGGVREGERIVVDGLPYRIAALRFYTRLENPDLQGGVLRVPVQFLVGQRSRPCGADEPWFPCRVGDIVLLADGSMGPVRVQTPEVVVVEHLGTERSYPTVQFLGLAPRNLSRGFVVESSLVVGRDRLADVTTVVRERLETAVRTAIAEAVAADLVLDVQVRFAAVSNQGLELVAIVACKGGAAASYFTLRRTMQRAFVEACRTHGWSLPVPVLVAAAP